MNVKKLIFFCFIALTNIFLFACEDKPIDEPFFSLQIHEVELTVGDVYEFTYDTNIIKISINTDSDIISINENTITALGKGNCTIVFLDGEEKLDEVKVTIKEKEVEEEPYINISSLSYDLEINETKKIIFETNRLDDVIIVNNNEELFTIENNVIIPKMIGDGKVYIKLYDNYTEINIHIYKNYTLEVINHTEIELGKVLSIKDLFVTDYSGEINYTVSDNIKYENGSFEMVKEGTAFIKASFIDNQKLYEVTSEFSIFKGYVLYFENSEIRLKIGYEEIIEPITDYPGELTITVENNEVISLDDIFVMAISNGESLVTVSFEADGRTYSTSILIIVEKELKDFNIVIDGKLRRYQEDSNIYDILYDVFNGNYYEEREGYIFKGWYYDIDLFTEVNEDDTLTNNVELYPKYIMNENCIYINQVFNDRDKAEAVGDIITVSPVYRYFDALNLDNYKLYVVKYDIGDGLYKVLSVDDKEVPFDGFLIGVKKDSSQFSMLDSKLQVGVPIYLDTYTVNTSRNFSFDNLVNYEAKPISVSLGCNFSSVYDVYTHTTLYSKNGDQKAYPASTTKIVTAIAALTYCPIDAKYKIGSEQNLMWEGSTPGTAGMKVGDVWTLEEILYAALLPSGNDAAYAAAACTINYLYPNHNFTNKEVISKFAELMNEVFEKVGAKNSHFMTPDGNSYYTSSGEYEERLANHYTTANDMIKVATYAFSIPALCQIVSTPSISFKIANGSYYSFNNTNQLLRPTDYYFKGTIGLKTGTTTPAGPCLISGVERNRRFVISVVYKAQTSSGRYTDSLTIYNEIFK